MKQSMLCRIFGHKWKYTTVQTEVGWLNIRRCKRCNKCSDNKYEDYKFKWNKTDRIE